MWRLWLPTIVKAVSVSVTWRLRRWARRIALTWRHYVRTSPSRTVSNPSSISQTTDKTFYGGSIHTKLRSNLLLPWPYNSLTPLNFRQPWHDYRRFRLTLNSGKWCVYLKSIKWYDTMCWRTCYHYSARVICFLSLSLCHMIPFTVE